jgi:hypothetical protein
MQELGVVKSLHLYPVKSFAGQAVHSFQMTSTGPKGDREFMVVKGDGTFITQRSHPKMALLGLTSTSEGKIHITGPELNETCAVNDEQKMQVKVWQDTVPATRVSTEVDAIVSRYLGVDGHLVKIASPNSRKKEKNGQEYHANFPDAAPVLLTNENSLEDLRQRFDAGLTMLNFRPNIVVSFAEPWIEKRVSQIKVGEIVFPTVYACTRCKIINLSQKTGEKEFNILQSLARESSPVEFGLRMLHKNQGVIKVGQKVYGEMF